jgi:hypothetical protein
MSGSYDGERKQSFRCMIHLHDWKLRGGGDGQTRFLACTRRNKIDDSARSSIPRNMAG